MGMLPHNLDILFWGYGYCLTCFKRLEVVATLVESFTGWVLSTVTVQSATPRFWVYSNYLDDFNCHFHYLCRTCPRPSLQWHRPTVFHFTMSAPQCIHRWPNVWTIWSLQLIDCLPRGRFWPSRGHIVLLYVYQLSFSGTTCSVQSF